MNIRTRWLSAALFTSLLFLDFGLAYGEGAVTPQPAVATPASSKVSATRAKIAEAETRCSAATTYQTPLRATHGRLRVKGKLRMKHFTADRPVILCGFRASDQSWHVVEVRVHSTAKEGERVFSYTPVTPGYSVDRLLGRGTTRLMFDLTDLNGEHIVVYRMRHLDIPHEAIDRELPGRRLLELATVQTYTPAHPDFADPDHTLFGMRYLKSEILAAQQELRDAGVPSETFTERLLADVIPWEIPMALGAIEQMDDERFVADERAEIESVYLHYALNGEKAFRYSVSPANATGAFQFTNKNGNGTYSWVVRECKGAALDPRFPEGAQNLRNAIKAAICLLDMELAQLPSAQELYRRKPLIGGIYPVAAYNGGHGWAVELENTLAQSGVDLEGENVELPDRLIIRRPSANAAQTAKKRTRIRISRKIENKETAIYVQKYVAVINFLADHVYHLDSDDTASPPTR